MSFNDLVALGKRAGLEVRNDCPFPGFPIEVIDRQGTFHDTYASVSEAGSAIAKHQGGWELSPHYWQIRQAS